MKKSVSWRSELCRLFPGSTWPYDCSQQPRWIGSLPNWDRIRLSQL
jgi:hypothetical protein